MKSWRLVVASGPSLTRADCDALQDIGQAIAVNNAVFYTPWADYLYAGDANWWKVYGPDVEWFKGRRLTYQDYKRSVSGNRFKKTGSNSGHQSFQYAINSGAKQIALLGFDHQRTNGLSHFHVDHKRHVVLNDEAVFLDNASHISNWVVSMDTTAKDAADMGVEVINLSRETALTCFPRMTVEDFVERYKC